jgi:peptidoglycan LD-endopeptidase CwlK
MPRFSQRSLDNLKDVDPRLVAVYLKAIEVWDCTIIDGIRSVEEQVKNVAKGVSKTMASKHLPDRQSGKAQAIDAMPWDVETRGIPWTQIQKGLDALKRLDGGMEVLEAYCFQSFVAGIAHAEGLKVRQGIDWDSDEDFNDQSFIDIPHTEIVD